MLPIASAGDHLLTLGDALRSQNGDLRQLHPRRGALAAGSKTWYLLAPGLGPDERARRRVNEKLHSLHEQMLLLKGAGESTGSEQERVDGILEGPRRRGEHVRAARGYVAPYVGSPVPTEMSLLGEMTAAASPAST